MSETNEPVQTEGWGADSPAPVQQPDQDQLPAGTDGHESGDADEDAATRSDELTSDNE